MAVTLQSGRTYRSYLLALLAIILTFNYVDRLALGLVLQSIKTEFHVSDTELGVLSGIAFAIFYSTLGIPIGRWADKGNRARIVTVTTGLWSIMVLLSGGARSFVQLLLVRIGVGVGEAGCIPPAYSLIGDYYTRAERPKAVANYLLGGSLSVVIGYSVAGWLNELYGWRVMFVLLGIPGVVLSALSWLTVREPRTTGFDRVRGGSEVTPNIKQVCRYLWSVKTFRHVVAMLCVNYFFGIGINQWLPAFFVRAYNFRTGELGIWFAAIYGIGGAIGTYFGGYLAARFAAGDESLQLRVIALLNGSYGVVSVFVYLSHDPYVSFALMSVGAVVVALGTGPLMATIQAVVPERMRGVSVSIVFLFANLIGMGLGPLAVGIVSDALRPWLGAESLRYALLGMSPGYIWGGWHLWRAARTALGEASVIPERLCENAES